MSEWFLRQILITTEMLLMLKNKAFSDSNYIVLPIHYNEKFIIFRNSRNRLMKISGKEIPETFNNIWVM